MMDRRNFTKNVLLGTIALQTPLLFAETNCSRERKKIPLGLCNHSLRTLKPSAKQLIQYAIDHKLDSLLLNSFHPFESTQEEHLTILSQLAKEYDISVYIGSASISELSYQFTNKYKNGMEVLKEGIRIASFFNSPIVGCRIGGIQDRYIDGGIEAHMELVIKTMKSMRSQAQDAGVKFALENHMADMRSNELKTIIEETGEEICGALFDPVNAVWAVEDPIEALLNLKEKVICTSVRDVAIWETEKGAMFQGMAIGEGMIDFPKYAKVLQKHCLEVPLHVETISNNAREIPYKSDEFWKGFPKLDRNDIKDFEKFVSKGMPQLIKQTPEGMTKKEFNIEYQKSELSKSLTFLRSRCNAGLKA